MFSKVFLILNYEASDERRRRGYGEVSFNGNDIGGQSYDQYSNIMGSL